MTSETSSPPPAHSPPSGELHVFYTPLQVADYVGLLSPSAAKPRQVVESWSALGIPFQIVRPEPVTIEQLCATHDPWFVHGVLEGTIPNGFGNTDAGVAASLRYTSGSMLSAARWALRQGGFANAAAPCSGFHHAGYRTAEGFCTFNGLVVTAMALLQEGVRKVGILDLDMHYGNGTVELITKHHLESRVEHYTAGLVYTRPTQAQFFLLALPSIVESFRSCDVLLYQAGADPHIEDPYGGWLTTEQLAERDRIVFQTCRKENVPVVWNLAGGYQTPLRKVLDIHDNTFRAAFASLRP